MIFVQEIVMCKLVIDSYINNKNENVVIEGKGYYKNEKGVISIYFTSEENKYKYFYENDILSISCNDSIYNFKLNREELGKIKNGDYVFEITTFATRIEVGDKFIIVEYNLSQNNTLIGTYKSKLSF